MSDMSGASTYAVGQVALSHFGSNDDLTDVDMERAKRAYGKAFERGKEFVANLKGKEKALKDVYESLEDLGKLKEQGIITEEEFDAQKQKLLDRI